MSITQAVLKFVTFVGYTGLRDLYRARRNRSERPDLILSLYDPVSDEKPTPKGAMVRFYHLQVRNMGRTDARGCLVRLLSVHAEPGFKEMLGGAELPLHWAHRLSDVEPRLIRAEEMAKLDLVYQEKASPRNLNVFTTRLGPDGLRKCYGPGRYVFKLRLTSENAATRDLRVTIEHSGDWADPAKLTLA